MDLPGLNSKMTEACALVGLWSLSRAEEILRRRAAVAARYVAHFASHEQAGRLATMRVAAHVHCPYLYFPVVLPEEATPFVAHMAALGIAVRRYYTANHALTFYRGKVPPAGSCEV